jgi:hypothetical protein
VEIDGFHKIKQVNEADEARQSSMSARQNDLVGAGWTVLRFTNRQVSTSPGACRTDIETILRASQTPVYGIESARPSQPTVHRQPALSAETRGQTKTWARVLGSIAVVIVIGVAALLLVLGTGDGSADPIGGSCPSDHPIKGNVTDDGDRIYHEPGWEFYSRTIPEDCFETAGDAEEAGFRPSEVQ